MNRAARRRDARTRVRRNTPDPATGGVRPRNQHGRVAFLWDAAAERADYEFAADMTPGAMFERCFPDASRVVMLPAVCRDVAIIGSAQGALAQMVDLGAYGDRVLTIGWCEHVRDAAARMLGMQDAPELVEAFADEPEGWLVIHLAPGAPILGEVTT